VALHGRWSVDEARFLNGTILIYGATGYTGKLIAKAAVVRGSRPILAGRNLDKVKAVAEPLGLTARALDLGDPAHIDAAIKDISVLLCVAGRVGRRHLRFGHQASDFYPPAVEVSARWPQRRGAIARAELKAWSALESSRKRAPLIGGLIMMTSRRPRSS